MIQTRAVLETKETMGATQILHLQAPDLAARLHPGQPVLIQTGWGDDPFLRRTFHPNAIGSESFSIRLAPDADRGRAWLRLAQPGVELDCLGPVGRGFTLPPHARRILCLGQDDGAWALLTLVHEAAAQGYAVTLATAAHTRRQIIPAAMLPISVEYHIATTDGSAGRKGDLRSLLPDLLPWADAVIAAANMDFYRHLGRAIEAARVLLPKGYAQALYQMDFLCGTGACQACAVDIAGGRRRVCLRGPAFDLVDILR
jgi:dihydroorotate dehydrogenase electron transfer subunit